MIFLTTNRVPLQSHDGFLFFNKIIGETLGNWKLYSGRHGKSREFKYSVGKFTLLFSSATVLIDLNEISSPDNIFCKIIFNASTSMFLAANMAH